MIRLNAKGMEKLSEISSKYKFRCTFEIEQDEVYDFCNALLGCAHLGLEVDADDEDFIIEVRDKLAGGDI